STSIDAIPELHPLVGFSRPPRLRRIGRRDHLRRLPTGRCGRRPVRTATAAIGTFLGLRLGLKSGKIPRRCTLLTLCVAPFHLAGRFPVLAAGIGFHNACVHRESLVTSRNTYGQQIKSALPPKGDLAEPN